jgi:uncharacterized protein YjbI with pentapeptide repeats
MIEIRHDVSGAVLVSGETAKWAVEHAIEMNLSLDGADFKAMDLAGANLGYGKFHDACFVGANLAGASLADADLSGADFYGADLTGANLARADLTGARLEGTTLVGADLTEAMAHGVCGEDANFTGAKLVRAEFGDADIDRSVFVDADCTGVRFAVTWFTGARFSPGAFGAMDLTEVRGDFMEILDMMPEAVAGLLGTLRDLSVDAFVAEIAERCGSSAELFGIRECGDWAAAAFLTSVRRSDNDEPVELIEQWTVAWQDEQRRGWLVDLNNFIHGREDELGSRITIEDIEAGSLGVARSVREEGQVVTMVNVAKAIQEPGFDSEDRATLARLLGKMQNRLVGASSAGLKE